MADLLGLGASAAQFRIEGDGFSSVEGQGFTSLRGGVWLMRRIAKAMQAFAYTQFA